MGVETRHKTVYTTGPRAMMESPHSDALVGLFDLRFGSLADRMRNLASITAPIAQPIGGDLNALTPGYGFLHFPGLVGINTGIKRQAGAFTWIFLGQQDSDASGEGPTYISEVDWRNSASSGQQGATMVRGGGQGIFRRYVPVIDTSTSIRRSTSTTAIPPRRSGGAGTLSAPTMMARATPARLRPAQSVRSRSTRRSPRASICRRRRIARS